MKYRLTKTQMKQNEQELTPPEELGLDGKWVVERMALEGSHVVILWRWAT